MNSACNNVVALQPKIVSRERALAEGARYYFTGKPCKYGHIAFRDVGQKACLECYKLRLKLPKHPLNLAKAAGAKEYFTGEPCVKGHIAPRRTNNHACVVCAQEYRNKTKVITKEYDAEYRSKNRERINARRRVYIEENKVRVLAQRAKQYQNRRQLNRLKVMWQGAKGGAKARGLEFIISIGDLSIPECCPVFPWIKLNLENKGRMQDDSPSIDRIDSSKGYIPGNICVISWRANRMKGDASPLELQALLAYISRSLG